MNMMTQTFGCLVDHLPEGFGTLLVESQLAAQLLRRWFWKIIHCEKRTWLAGKSPVSIGDASTQMGGIFQPVMLVNSGVCISLVTIGFCCYDSRDSKKRMTLPKSSKLNLNGVSLGVIESFSPIDVIFRNSNFLKSLSHRIDESYIYLPSPSKWTLYVSI